MKRLSNLLAALVFASLVIFMSCGGGGDDPAPDPFADTAVELTASAWAPTSVNGPDGNVTTDWSDFTLSFTGNGEGGSFTTNITTSNPEFTDVWPASGTWSFGSSVSVINRSDNVVMDAAVSATSLTLEFTVTESARTNGIAGDWVFVFGN